MILGYNQLRFLVFTSPTGYTLTSSDFVVLFTRGIFLYRFLYKMISNFHEVLNFN